jgi:hypothetical protein
VLLCSLCEGKEGEIKFTYRLFSLTTGVKNKMLLVVFLGLIATLALVCADCDVGSWGVDNFDYNKVGIGVLIQILSHQLLKLWVTFIFHLWFH